MQKHHLKQAESRQLKQPDTVQAFDSFGFTSFNDKQKTL